MAGVTDVEHGEALAGPDPRFVVHLGDERAHRVHDVAALGAGRVDHFGRRAVRRQHERRAGRDLGDVVDEHHALLAEALDHEPVVDDLVVAVHGRLEGPHHPGERLDRHLDAGAEAARLGEQHGLDGPAGGRSHAIEASCAPPSSEMHACTTRNLGECLPLVFLLSRPDPRRTTAGIATGDEILAVNGEQLRDVIAYQLHADGAEVDFEVRRGGLEQQLVVHKAEGAPLGLELAHAVFDRVQTCDNHCPFCFIHQLPKGMRRSLYLQDDDFRLSFLYGNFTTLTRFTEADFERVITEKLSPLYVSIHATDPEVRTRLLRNRRGATSLRWLELLLDAGVEVHGQVVVCPGINDGAVLDDTMLGVLDRFPKLATVGVVPLGVSAHSHEPEMRPHTTRGSARRASTSCTRGRRASPPRSAVGSCSRPTSTTSSREREFPPLDAYDDVPPARERHRHGAHVRGRGRGRARRRRRGADRHPFRLLRRGRRRARRGLPRAAHRRRDRRRRADARRPRARATRRSRSSPASSARGCSRRSCPRSASAPAPRFGSCPVANRFFGGNIGVTGLLAGADVAAALADAARRRPLPAARRRALARQVPRRRDGRGAAAPGRGRRDRRRRARARRLAIRDR